MQTETHMNLEAAMDLADHASPAPWSASLALKAMRAEILRLQANLLSGDSHPDDVAVDRFAVTLKAKLAEARAKGRAGWQDRVDCPQQRLSDMLRAHVEKGDPRDVGAFCMFLQQRGEAILPAQEKKVHPADEAEAFIRAAIDRAPEPLRRLGEYLTRVLDDDHFATAEQMLLGACEMAAQNPAERVRVPDAVVQALRGVFKAAWNVDQVRVACHKDLDLLRDWLAASAPEASSHG